MRNSAVYLGAALWAAVAVLLPLAALEPVAVARAGGAPAILIAGCVDGSTPLLMGCAGSQL